MPSLRELQQGFADAVLGPPDAPPAFDVSPPRTGAERIAIYRTALLANYRRALSASYPVVKRLTGEDWVSRVAQIGGFWDETRPAVRPGSGPGWSRGEVAFHPLALGEIGLDRFHLPKVAVAAEKILDWQRAAFAEQLKLARRLSCPVVIHSRGAFADCVEMIDRSGVAWNRVVFHCFTEGPAEMAELVRRGGYGSFTGVITYKSAEAVRAAALAQGLERLMIETDAPYLTPMPHRGKPNEPAYLRHTAEFCAGLFGVSYERLAEVTTATAKKFFGLSP